MKNIYKVIIILFVIAGFQSALQNVYARAITPPLNQSVDDNKNTSGIWIKWEDNPAFCDNCTPYVLVVVRTPGSDRFEKIRNFPPEITSYLYKAAKPGEEYQFQIGYCATYDQSCNGFISYGTDGTIHTGVQRLTAPTNLSASDGTSSSGIDVDWDNHPQQSAGSFYYRIWTSATGYAGSFILGPGVSGSAYSDRTSLDPLERRYYKVEACIDRCGSADYDDGFRGLATPSSLIVSDDTAGVNLDWSAVTNATHYQVSRSDDKISWSELSSPASSAYSDSTGDINVEYTYRIRACARSPSTCGSYVYGTGLRGIYPPVISSDPLLGGGIKIDWTHADRDSADHYRIFRSLQSDPESMTLIVKEPIANVSYTDATAVIDTDYIYEVRACKSIPTFCSNPSNRVFARWSACYRLTVNVVGQGAVPSFEPKHSAGCPSGNTQLYSAEQRINFYDVAPSVGWRFDHWTGTFAPDSDVAVMPAKDHTVTAHYVEDNPSSDDIFTNGFENDN